MKLEIDLMKPDEVAAGLVLLGRVGEAQRSTLTVTAPQPANVAEVMARTTVEEGEQFYTLHGSAALDEDAKKLEALGGDPGLTAAQVFGGSPVTVPLPPTIVPPGALVPSVPTPPIPGAVTSGAAVELDKAGLPWDSRIHSSSKNKLANGMWKVARGKAPEYVKEVEAQLRNNNGPYAPEYAPPAGGMPVTVPLPPLVPSAVPYAAMPAAGALASAPTPDPTTFETLMTRVSPAIVGGILPAAAVGAACTAAGLTSVVALQSSPQFVPTVWATLKAQFPGLQ